MTETKYLPPKYITMETGDRRYAVAVRILGCDISYRKVCECRNHKLAITVCEALLRYTKDEEMADALD